MEKLRFGIVGVGAIGGKHADSIASGRVPGAELTAVTARSEGSRAALRERYHGAAIFQSADEMFDSGLIDAALLATPHGEHPAEALSAFGRGLHVLTEKPAGMYTAQVLPVIDAARGSGRVFGIMYNQRTNPVYGKIRQLYASGSLGAIKRITWIVTDWYRSQAYHTSGTWHSTWRGEGGGVLLNQSIHQLDLWQWMFGMPDRVWARAGFGRYHDIEVEDNVMAHFEYENGVTGQYITSTGETPGTNRLEIACDMGRLVAEGGSLTFLRNDVSEREFERTNSDPFGRPGYETVPIPTAAPPASGHEAILADFTSVCLHGGRLIAPGEEGIRALTMANGALLSAWTGEWVDLSDFPHRRYRDLLSAKAGGLCQTGGDVGINFLNFAKLGDISMPL